MYLTQVSGLVYNIDVCGINAPRDNAVSGTVAAPIIWKSLCRRPCYRRSSWGQSFVLRPRRVAPTGPVTPVQDSCSLETSPFIAGANFARDCAVLILGRYLRSRIGGRKCCIGCRKKDSSSASSGCSPAGCPTYKIIQQKIINNAKYNSSSLRRFRYDSRYFFSGAAARLAPCKDFRVGWTRVGTATSQYI